MNFIKYCIKCLSIATSTAFGNSPKGSTFKECLIGYMVLIFITAICLLILFLLTVVAKKFFHK